MANSKKGRVPESDERETPGELYHEKHATHHFDLDAAASHHNTQCAMYFTQHGQYMQPLVNGIWARAPESAGLLSYSTGLTGSWKGRRVWVNPPYSGIAPWIVKAWESEADLVYMLVPNWTDRAWWQDCVEPFRDKGFVFEGFTLRTEFTKRKRFLYKGLPIRTESGTIGQPEFGLVGLIWTRKETER